MSYYVTILNIWTLLIQYYIQLFITYSFLNTIFYYNATVAHAHPTLILSEYFRQDKWAHIAHYMTFFACSKSVGSQGLFCSLASRISFLQFFVMAAGL